MFSSLTQRLGPRTINRLGLLIELSTLGEYGAGRQGVCALQDLAEGPAAASARPSPSVGRPRGSCAHRGRITQVGGGAARL